MFYVKKPIGQYNILLPSYFRQIFGVGWDILNGLLAISSFIFVTWFRIDRNFYCLLLNSYLDVVIIFDASLSLFIRFYQSIQVVAVNKNIEAVLIAAWNVLGFTLDIFSCLPYVALLMLTPRNYLVCAYQGVCILRFLRLFTPRRQFLDKSLYEKAFSEIQLKDGHFEQLKLAEFGHFGNIGRNPSSGPKKTKFPNKQRRKMRF